MSTLPLLDPTGQSTEGMAKDVELNNKILRDKTTAIETSITSVQTSITTLGLGWQCALSSSVSDTEAGTSFVTKASYGYAHVRDYKANYDAGYRLEVWWAAEFSGGSNGQGRLQFNEAPAEGAIGSSLGTALQLSPGGGSDRILFSSTTTAPAASTAAHLVIAVAIRVTTSGTVTVARPAIHVRWTKP